MSDLICTNCGTKTTYAAAEALSNGYDIDGNPVEQDCDHKFVENSEH